MGAPICLAIADRGLLCHPFSIRLTLCDDILDALLLGTFLLASLSFFPQFGQHQRPNAFDYARQDGIARVEEP